MSGPLSGVQVLDFTQAWAGPMCTQILADYGADVLKVESGTRPDVSRTMGPYPGDVTDYDASGYFIELNRNKRSISLNLREAGDVETALTLAQRADVVVENFAPGVIERLGLSYEVLRERRPGLIMLSISGFGSTGPDRAAVAFGQQVEAECGLMSITGYGDGVPLKPGVSYPDPVAGIGGAGAVAAALLHRDRTGEGQWIDLSMLEITVALLVEPVLRHARTGVADGAHANASRYVAPHGIYPCLGEDRWIAIECHDDAQWRALAGVIADPWVRDHRWESNPGRLEHTTELDAQLAAFTASHTAPELAERLQEAGVPAAAVADPADLAADPQLRATGWWQHVEHPVAGPLDLPGPIARLSVTPAVTHRPPPLLGQHTDEVMSELARV